jgi:enoyl-CoA hydratase/carnithine racemase
VLAPPCLGLAEAVARLLSPYANETWSPLTGAPLLAVDARDLSALPAATALAPVVARLAALPCPSVALVTAPLARAAEALLGAFDVVVETVADLAAVTMAVTQTPHAAATLVHVLRAGRALAVPEALTLESLAYGMLQGGPEFARWLGTRPGATPRPGATTPAVRMERANGTLAITLDRPERHNAFSARMRDDLMAALAVATAEPTLTVVVRGAGPSFSSGGDLDEFGTSPDPVTAHLVRATRSPARLLAAMAGRVRVEVHGACIGAGVELAAFARHVVATPDAFFQLPEVAMGLIPGAGGTASLPRRIGRQRTAYLALTGRRLDVVTARAWGLIDAIAGAPALS